MARVLLTGATGFVGRHAIAPLLDAGHDVHAVSREPSFGDAVTWHGGDLLEPGVATTVIREAAPELLLHFAWYAEPGKFWTSELNGSWQRATVALLEAFAAAGGRRAVLAGTCAEYGWKEETHCIEGETPLAPATPYGQAKDATREAVEALAARDGIEVAWGRVFFLFGPAEDPRRLGGAVASGLVRGEPVATSSGEQVRDFLYTPELADAFVALLDSEVTGAVNVASGVPLRLHELIDALGAAAGRPELIRRGERPTNPSEPAVLTADVSRLRDEVGWTPTLSLEEAAERTIAWWRANGAA
jgi:nucleoside-diphosphate-sugar epimerase